MSIGNTRRTLTVLSFAPNDVVTATGNETGVDLLDYEGDITLILMQRLVALASPMPSRYRIRLTTALLLMSLMLRSPLQLPILRLSRLLSLTPMRLSDMPVLSSLLLAVLALAR